MALNILVFGAGAIGGYLGGSLALQGQRVVFLERERNLAELRGNGLQLTLADGSQHSPKVEFVSSYKDAQQTGRFDVALFALKSYDTAAALESLRQDADALPPFLCLQNGIDNEAAIAALIGEERVIAGTVTTAVARGGRGQVRVERLRGVGIADGHLLSQPLAEAMNAAGLNAKLYADGAAMKWSKLLTNLLTNASCAIMDMSPAEVIAHPELFKLECAAQREAVAVMRAQKLKVVDVPGVPVRALATAVHLPAWMARPLMARSVGRGRGGKMPSLHIDLHSGKGRSEVEWLNGAVVRAGQRLGEATPVNAMLAETLSKLVSGDVPIAAFRHQPEKLLRQLAIFP
jgi:2-dehydropantoate 2-reductase